MTTSFTLDYLRSIAQEAAANARSQREAILAQALLELTANSETVEVVFKLTDRAKQIAAASSWSFQDVLESLMVASDYVIAPAYSVLDATGATERGTMTLTGNQLWRQRGWIGQTGRIYGLREDPSPTEPGSFAPLWELVEDEPPAPSDSGH